MSVHLLLSYSFDFSPSLCCFSSRFALLTCHLLSHPFSSNLILSCINLAGLLSSHPISGNRYDASNDELTVTMPHQVFAKKKCVLVPLRNFSLTNKMYNMVVPFIFILLAWLLRDKWELMGQNFVGWDKKGREGINEGNVSFQISECHTLTMARMKHLAVHKNSQTIWHWMRWLHETRWEKIGLSGLDRITRVTERDDFPGRDVKKNVKSKAWGKQFKWSTGSGDDDGRRDEMMRQHETRHERSEWDVEMQTADSGQNKEEARTECQRWWPHFTSETSQNSVPYVSTVATRNSSSQTSAEYLCSCNSNVLHNPKN